MVRPMTLDCDISFSDVQQLANADAVVAFFARLGYNTHVRTEQTPENLGITANGTRRPIKRIELIADQEGLFQVYLSKLTSVTITHTRALARAFRTRAGNFLLVLTSDYEQLDFVLVQKYLPTGPASRRTITTRQVAVRPRALTVDRRKPTRVQLRVLRRFTYTESDPFAQYEKLLSAYDVADWSEDFFNNRALFSDYFLRERLPERSEWAEDPKRAYRALLEVYGNASSRFGGKPESAIRSGLLEPTLAALGFTARRGKKARSPAVEPDYRLYGPDGSDEALVVCLAYPWGRSLDGKDDQRDKDTPDENPGFVVVSLLEEGEAPWAIVTNGKTWRLYAQRTHSKATNYYEIDLEETLAESGPHAGDPAEAFRYFWLLFRREAFEPVPVEREGRTQKLSFLDQLLLGSEDYAKELGERLKGRVFEDIFPHLAQGFITHIRERDGVNANLSQEALDDIFQGTLTLLYRLLFLLYAESRALLPVKEVRGYYEASLTRLKQEMAEAAGRIEDEAGARLKKHHRADQYGLYDRLTRLFAVVDQGAKELNVPVYNGGLFLSEPEEDDDTAEARNARFLNETKVPDRYLARAIDLLARDIDPKRQDLVPIDFKSLGVRHLGSIYEGLLEFKLRIAPEKMAVVKGKKTEEVVPYREATAKSRRILKQGRGKNAKERVYRKGDLYLENDRRERKATGSYYTPDHIVKYIVDNTVGPILQEKFDKIRPLIRDAQKKRRAFSKEQEAFRKQGMKTKPDSQADLIGEEVVDQLFDIKVLDPAMGSGHFLVETVDFITDKMLDFLNAFPWNPVVAHLEKMRETILGEMEEQGITIDEKRLTPVNLLKRHVLKRCVYGVDLNPMAVELAKVSLWLDCFTLGAPLSFLDHHLRCGNSLIGVTVEEAQAHLQQDLFGSRFAGLLSATELMRHVGELSDITSAQVEQSRSEYRRATDALASFKRILDVYTSQWFGNAAQKKRRGKKAVPSNPALDFFKSPLAQAFFDATDRGGLDRALGKMDDQDRRAAEGALADAVEKRFFHWELEFPESYYGPAPESRQKVVRLEDPGFDAVIGNPPYVDSEEMTRTMPEIRKACTQMMEACSGNWDLYCAFVAKGIELLRRDGIYSQIVPNKLLAAGYAKGARDVIKHNTLQRLTDYAQVRVFADSAVYPVVPVIKRAPPTPRSRILVEVMAEDPGLGAAAAYTHQVGPDVAGLLPASTWAPLLSGDWPILERILKESVELGALYEVSGAATVAEAYELQEILREDEGLDIPEDSYGFVNSGTIDRYKNLWGIKPCRYLGESYQRPLVGRQDLAALLPIRAAQAGSPKIAIAGMTQIIEAIIDGGQYLVGKSCVLVTHGSWQHLLFALGLLNSRVASFAFRRMYDALSLQGGYLRIGPPQIRTLPVPKRTQTTLGNLAEMKARFGRQELASVCEGDLLGMTEEDLTQLVVASAGVLASAGVGNLRDTASRADRLIDRAVGQLFGLSPETIRSISSWYEAGDYQKEAP